MRNTPSTIRQPIESSAIPESEISMRAFLQEPHTFLEIASEVGGEESARRIMRSMKAEVAHGREEGVMTKYVHASYVAQRPAARGWSYGLGDLAQD